MSNYAKSELLVKVNGTIVKECSLVSWVNDFNNNDMNLLVIERTYVDSINNSNFYNNIHGNYVLFVDTTVVVISAQKSDNARYLILQDAGAAGILLNDRGSIPGLTAALTYPMPTATIPIGMISGACTSYIAKLVNNYTGISNVVINVVKSDPNQYLSFFNSDGYVAWWSFLIAMYIVGVLFGIVRMVGFLWNDMNISLNIIVISLETINCFLRMLQFSLVPLTNTYHLNNGYLLATLAFPFSLSASIVVVFFWLDLTSGTLYSGNFLKKMKIPAIIVTIILFLVEIMVDIYRITAVRTDYVVYVSFGIYLVVTGSTACFYFYASFRVLKVVNKLKKKKATVTKWVTFKILGAGVCHALAILFAILVITVPTTPTSLPSFWFLLFFFLAIKSYLTILIFSPKYNPCGFFSFITASQFSTSKRSKKSQSNSLNPVSGSTP